MSSSMYGLLDRLYRVFESRPKIYRSLYFGALAILAALGIYLRAIPGIQYGVEFFEADSFIEYWQAKYVYERGPLSWYALTRGNQDTHIFWHPNGRDFTQNSYPGLPMWIGVTYHVAKHFGISLKDWACLQPLVFAALSYLTLYLAVREISRGNKYAILMAFTIFTLLPAASDRSIIGFIEKEGVALTFIFLTIYFYSKLARMINDSKYTAKSKLKYTILTSLSIAAVGWFWGGYIYVLGTFVAFVVLYPIFNSRAITVEYVKYHLALIALAIVFEIPSPANLNSLGLAPFRPRSIGVAMVAAAALPALFSLFHNYYKRVGLKKPLLNSTRYFFVLALLAVVFIALYVQGIVHIGDRFAWALGLRVFKPAPPLVESIEEHQSPLSSTAMFRQLLISWGTGLEPLLLFAPLFMAVFGIFYLIYCGGMDQVYLAIAFALGFYSYLNAAYMEATAASTGVVAAAVFIGYVMSKILPSRGEINEWKRGRKKAATSFSARLLALAITALVLVNIGFSGVNLYEQHNLMMPGMMNGFTPLRARNSAWYKLIEFLQRNLTRDAVVVSWWDYGYPLSVGGGVRTVADGATLNGSQIRLLAKLLTAKSLEEVFNISKLLKLPANNTYIMVFDVFIFERVDNDTYTVKPYFTPYNIVGLVDIPKSIWMIRIGEREVADYLYLYDIGTLGRGRDQHRVFYIAPRLDQPETLPLIYKIMVDGILSLSLFRENTTYVFQWFTGSVMDLEFQTEYVHIKEILGIERMISVHTDRVTGQPSFISLEPKNRPFANVTHIKPYTIIVEPFQGIDMGGESFLAEVLFIYKLNLPE